MPPLDEDQLRAEAGELAKGMREGEGATAGDHAAPEGESPTDGAAGGAPGGDAGDGGEYIPNPARAIAGALKRALAFPLTRKVLPPRVLAVFDDATVEELADAVGQVVQIRAGAIARLLHAGGERFGPEAALTMVLLGIAYRIYEALEADQDAMRAAAARDVGSESAASERSADQRPKVDGDVVAPT